jgi:hypothetical protein
MDPRDLVVTLVLEPAAPGEKRVQRRRRVAALGQEADRLGAASVVDLGIEEGARVQRVALTVERVAGVLHHEQLVPTGELDVVGARVRAAPRRGSRSTTNWSNGWGGGSRESQKRR